MEAKNCRANVDAITGVNAEKGVAKVAEIDKSVIYAAPRRAAPPEAKKILTKHSL